MNQTFFQYIVKVFQFIKTTSHLPAKHRLTEPSTTYHLPTDHLRTDLRWNEGLDSNHVLLYVILGNFNVWRLQVKILLPGKKMV